MKTKINKSAIITLFAVSVFMQSFAQDDKSTRPSPPAQVTKKVGATTTTINYCQPSVKGRKIWGDLVPTGKVWRAGANEATTFQIDKDSKINGQALATGKYGFFVIPNEKQWVIIFNKVADQWDAFKYDEKQDALRINVKPSKSSNFNEKLIYTINANGLVSLAWENVQISFLVK